MYLSNARQLYAATVEQLEKLKVQNVALEIDKEVLEQKKAELQKQVNTIEKQGVA